MTSFLLAYLLSPDGNEDARGGVPRSPPREDVSSVTAMHAGTDPLLPPLRSPDEAEARAAIEALFHATYVKLVRFAAHYVAAAGAEDAVADVFASVWANRATLDPRGSLEGYLFGAVRRRAISSFRQATRHDGCRAPVLAEGEFWGMGVPTHAPDTHVVAADVRETIWRAIAELPARQREILALRWQGELGWDEIARVLGSTSAAVQMQHSRAAKTLRARLTELLK